MLNKFCLSPESWVLYSAGFGRRLAINFQRFDVKFNTIVILETEFHENDILFPSQTSTNVTEKSFQQ